MNDEDKLKLADIVYVYEMMSSETQKDIRLFLSDVFKYKVKKNEFYKNVIGLIRCANTKSKHQNGHRKVLEELLKLVGVN